MMPNTNSIHSSSSHNNNTTPPSSPTPAAPKNTAVSIIPQQQQRSPTKSPFSKRLVLPRFLAPRKHRQQQQQQQDKKKKEQPVSSKDEQSKSSSSKSSHKTKRTSRGTPSKDSGGLPVFTITYCQNSSSNNSNNNNKSGGTPELRSAQSCVRSIFPECEIIERPVQRIPIRLTVTAELDGPPSYKIWQGQQQHLSRNDVPTRTLTMREMTAKLEQFRYNVGMTT